MENGKFKKLTKGEFIYELADLIIQCGECQNNHVCENDRLYCRSLLDHAFREEQGKKFKVPYPKVAKAINPNQ